MAESREPKEYKKSQGTITKKDRNEKNGPKGWLYLNGEKERYTIWSQSIFDKYESGDEVIVTYTIQVNQFNGKTYYNRVVDSIRFQEEGPIQITPKQYDDYNFTGKRQELKTIINSENGVVKLGGLFYRIKNVELELLKNMDEAPFGEEEADGEEEIYN